MQPAAASLRLCCCPQPPSHRLQAFACFRTIPDGAVPSLLIQQPCLAEPLDPHRPKLVTTKLVNPLRFPSNAPTSALAIPAHAAALENRAVSASAPALASSSGTSPSAISSPRMSCSNELLHHCRLATTLYYGGYRDPRHLPLAATLSKRWLPGPRWTAKSGSVSVATLCRYQA